MASLVAQRLKNPPAMWETWARPLGWEDPLEKEMATHSSIFAWRIPWTEEPGRLQSMESQKVGHDWTAKHSTAINTGNHAHHHQLLGKCTSKLQDTTLMPTRMTMIKKVGNYRWWRGCGKVRNLCTTGGYVRWCRCLENIFVAPQKIKQSHHMILKFYP